MSAFRGSSGSFFFICTDFGDNGNDFWVHRTNSELQLLCCLFPKLQFLSDPARQRSSDSGPVCLEDLVGYPWWDSAFGVGGSGRSPIECSFLPGTSGELPGPRKTYVFLKENNEFPVKAGRKMVFLGAADLLGWLASGT